MRLHALACTLFLAACSDSAAPDATTFSDSAGVRIASNDVATPVWGRGFVNGWTLAGNPSVQVGNILGNSDHDLYRVAHSHRMPDGGIAVANTGLGDVRLYTGQGDHVRTLDLGPTAVDEAQPLLVLPLGGDSLAVLQGDQTLSVFRGGVRAASRRLASPGDDFETPEPMGVFADGSLLFRSRFPWDTTATGIGHRRARLLRYAIDGSILATLADLTDDAVLTAERGAYLFAPAALYAAGDSTVWYGTADRYEVRELAPDGRVLRIVRLNRARTPVQQADSAAYRSAVLNRVLNTSREHTMEATLDASFFPDSFPTFDRLIVDDVGNLWLRNFQWFDLGSGKGWSVFDPEGRYLGDVTTPSILEIHQIGDDFVLGRMSDRAGREAVYLFPLNKPEKPPAPTTDSTAGP